MRHFLLSFLLFVLANNIYGQLTSISVKEVQNTSTYTRKIDVYDGSSNCPYKNYHLLVDQEVHVLPLPKEATIYNQNREKGYEGFKTIKFNIYKDKKEAKRYGRPALGDKNNTSAEDLEGKTFIVKSIDDDGEEYPTYVLLLEEKNNPQNVCQYIFKWSTEFDLTFISTKHLQYLKDSCIGKPYYFDKECLYGYDINTGAKLRNVDHHSWICEDIIVSPESGKITMKVSYEGSETYVFEYAGTMEHSTSNSVVENISKRYGEARQDLNAHYIMAYSQNCWNQLVDEYGEEMMWAALQHRVIKGMPYNLVRKALGTAKNSYNTSTGSVLDYDRLEYITKMCKPLVYFQNGKMKISIYFDTNHNVIGWSD